MKNRFLSGVALIVLSLSAFACMAPHLTIEAGAVNRIVFKDWQGPAISVWTYVPATVDRTEAPILMLMHGAKRNPARYLRQWQSLADEHGIIVVAPEFSKRDFPKSRAYNLGNVFERGTNDVNDESTWSFSAIEPLFDHVVAQIQSTQTSYAMFGHSAGSQFAHRFMYYKPDARVNLFLLANAGWYTLPDFGFEYPYGLRGAHTDTSRLPEAFAKNVVVLLGDRDNDPNHDSLRRTPEAMQQGPHRYARGHVFFGLAKRNAGKLGVPFAWRLKSVEGVAHSNKGMARAAAPYIVERQ